MSMSKMRLEDVQDDVRYPASVICAFLCGNTGKPLNVCVLKRWRAQGRVRMVRIAGRWYMTGAELRRFLAGTPSPEPALQGDLDNDADTAETGEVPREVIEELQRLGVNV